MGFFENLFKNELNSFAKKMSKEVYEYSFHTVNILISSEQSLPDEYENSTISWEKVSNEKTKWKLINEFQVFILYTLGRQALGILSDNKYKKFMDIITEETINNTPKIDEKIIARRYQEYIQYEIIPVNENLESNPEEIENSAIGRFSYHLSKILNEKIDPMYDGLSLYNLVITFCKSQNTKERLLSLNK